MAPEIDDWQLRMIQKQYADLDLSPDQAAQVWRWQERPRPAAGSDVESFSYWEEKDYEADELHKFLDEDQFERYLDDQRKAVAEHEQQLRDDDGKEATELAFQQEWIDWLEGKYLIDFCSAAVGRVQFPLEREKIEYLQKEYAKFLLEARHNGTALHYRNSRRLQPNLLQITLLYAERMRLLPDYPAMMRWADDALRAVVDFVLEKYRPLIREHADFFVESAEQLSQYTKELRQRYFNVSAMPGWRTDAPPQSDIPVAEAGFMSLMLMKPRL
jgi:hypothetical protein